MPIPPEPADPARAALSTGFVLVVDDNPDVRDRVCSELAAAGFDTVVAGDLRSARRLLETSEPDAVVLDLMLPDGEGTELLRPDGPPVIMLTGSTQPELVAVAL